MSDDKRTRQIFVVRAVRSRPSLGSFKARTCPLIIRESCLKRELFANSCSGQLDRARMRGCLVFSDVQRNWVCSIIYVSFHLQGGLQEVADQLDLQRIGRQHQAGSDSLLTGMAFFRMKELFFEDSIDDAKYCGRLYGLGTGVAQKQNEDVDSAQEKMSILAIINNMQQ
nr:PREDICTED: CCR4-NOT transcription complex subunit 8-like [Bos indicus]